MTAPLRRGSRRYEGVSKAALAVFSSNEIGNCFWENRSFTKRPDLAYRNKSIIEFKRIDTSLGAA